MKAKYIYTLAATVVLITGCEPPADRSVGSTNSVSPPTETNTVPPVNQPPAVATNAAVTNAPPP